MSEKTTNEKIEAIVHERIEPVLKDLDGRLALMEQNLKRDVEDVKTFARAYPIMALGVTLLGGVVLGFIWGKIGKSRDRNKD
jgi:hypothetical protein